MAVQAPPPTGYLEIERVLRMLALGESDLWIAGRLHGVDHPAAVEAAMLLRRGRRRQDQAVLETTLLQLAGKPDGNGLGWFRNAGLCPSPALNFTVVVARWLPRPEGSGADRRFPAVPGF